MNTEMNLDVNLLKETLKAVKQETVQKTVARDLGVEYEILYNDWKNKFMPHKHLFGKGVGVSFQPVKAIYKNDWCNAIKIFKNYAKWFGVPQNEMYLYWMEILKLLLSTYLFKSTCPRQVMIDLYYQILQSSGVLGQ